MDDSSGTLTDRSVQYMGGAYSATVARSPVLATCPPIDQQRVAPPDQHRQVPGPRWDPEFVPEPESTQERKPTWEAEFTREPESVPEPESGLEPQLATAEPQLPPQQTPGGVDEKARSLPWRVLHHSDYRQYFIYGTFSNFGTWLQNTGQALLAYHLVHSALAVGIVVSAQFSSVLVLGPWAGAVAARVRSRQQLLVVTQLASAGVAAALATIYLTGLMTEIWLAAGAFALGLAYCFALPAFSVLVPALVPERDTRSAMAMNSVSYNVGRAIAPPVAVLIITTIGFGWVFILNAVSFSALALVLLRLQPQRDLARPEGGKVSAGFRAACRDRSIWLLLAMVAAVTLAADPVLILGPVLAHHFDVSTGWAGGFLACLGAGTVAGSLLPLRVAPERLRDAAYPVFALGAAIIVFALGINLYLCLFMALIAGIACLMAGSVTQTLLLTLSGSRAAMVMAVWAIAWAGTKPLASLLDGLLAAHFGFRWAGIVLALPALLPAAIIVILPQRLWVKRPANGLVGQDAPVPAGAG